MFVQGRSGTCCLVEVISSFGVPSNPKAVHILQSVPYGNLAFGGLAIRVVGEEFGQVVIVNLLRQTVGWSDKDVLEETFFLGREVCEPSTHSECLI